MNHVLTCTTESMCFDGWLFLIAFIAMLLVTLWQLYRIMIAFYSKEYADDRAKSFVGFIGTLFAWVVMLVINILAVDNLLYTVLLNVGNFLLGLNVLFFIVNIFIFFSHLRGGERDRETSYSRSNRFLRRI